MSEVDYEDNRVLSGFSVDNDKVTVEICHKDEAGIDQKSNEKAVDENSCLYLIGADGSNSKVRRFIDSSWSKDCPRIIAYQSYMRFSDSGSLKDGSWNVFFEPEISDVLCSVHRKDDFLTLCVGGFKGRNLKQSMEKFKNLLSEKFNVVFEKEERWEGCVIRQASVNLGNGRVVLTGDAAGLMYLNGEGISAAIDSGYRAGKAVAKAIHKGIPAVELYKEQSRDILTHMIMCYKNMHFFAELC
jgi:flavin-dependent dehydrogenase